MEHASWGPSYSVDKMEKDLISLEKSNYKIEKIDDENLLCKKTAKNIAEGKIVGWFQGRSEWGPRALGNRSILVDPRRDEMKGILNDRIKRREPFRPFAPSIAEEDLGGYFENLHPSPFMLFTYKVKEEKKRLIPAVVHVDGTARLQTVNKLKNPLYWKLINEFKEITGIPVVLNTSFNENEPIVCCPKEALDCFMRTKMDVLAIGPFIIEKNLKGG